MICRYFLADHLLKQGAPALALEAIAASLVEPTRNEWLLRLVEAEAFSALGQIDRAKAAAARAVNSAPSPEKSRKLVERFSTLGLQSESAGSLKKHPLND